MKRINLLKKKGKKNTKANEFMCHTFKLKIHVISFYNLCHFFFSYDFSIFFYGEIPFLFCIKIYEYFLVYTHSFTFFHFICS